MQGKSPRRVALACVLGGLGCIVASVAVPAAASMDGHAASGKVIGMTSGGGVKSGGCALSEHPAVPNSVSATVKLTGSCTVSTVQSSGFTTMSTLPKSGTLTLTLKSSGGVSCKTLATASPEWVGTAAISLDNGNGAHIATLKYDVAFKPLGGSFYGPISGTGPRGTLDLTKLAGTAELSFGGGSCVATGGAVPTMSFASLLTVT